MIRKAFQIILCFGLLCPWLLMAHWSSFPQNSEMNMSHNSHENMEINHEQHDNQNYHCAQHCLSNADRVSQTVQISYKELEDHASQISLFSEEKIILVNVLSSKRLSNHSPPWQELTPYKDFVGITIIVV